MNSVMQLLSILFLGCKH